MRQEKEWFPANGSRMLALPPELVDALLVGIGLGGLYFVYVMLAVSRRSVGTRLFQQKRYTQATESYRGLLRWPLPIAIEAQTRGLLADALDCLGQSEGAEMERARALAVSERGTKDAQAQFARGDLLQRQHQYDDACAAYTLALKLTPRLASDQRTKLMANLAFVHHEAGRPAETVKWSEAALASSRNPVVQMLMHRMAGVCDAEMGELEKAEEHYNRSLKLAEAAGNPEEIAHTLALLADAQHRRGQFSDSLSAARRAVEVSDSPFRLGRMVVIENLCEMGEFDEARAAAAQAQQGPRHDLPDIERQMQARCALILAWVEASAEQPEAAMTALEEARELLRSAAEPSVWPPPPISDKDKLSINCDLALVCTHAHLGQRASAQRLRVGVEARLPRFANDRVILRESYSQFARAAYFSDELAESKELWQQYLDCKPSPVGLPYAYYWLGETFLRLGDPEQARKCFEQAVAPGIDSLDARRARARLNGMGA